MRKVIDRMHMEGVTICYGMTETSPVSTQTTAEDELERRVGTVGRVHPHVEVKVVEPETGHTVRRGEPGELCTRGYSRAENGRSRASGRNGSAWRERSWAFRPAAFTKAALLAISFAHEQRTQRVTSASGRFRARPASREPLETGAP